MSSAIIRPHRETVGLSRKVYTPNTKANLCIDKVLSELYLLKTVVDQGDKKAVKSKIDSIRSLLLDLKELM